MSSFDCKAQATFLAVQDSLIGEICFYQGGDAASLAVAENYVKVGQFLSRGYSIAVVPGFGN